MAKKTDSNVRSIAEVEAISKKMPAMLTKLLAKEGFDGTEIPQRGSKQAIERRLQKLGVFDQAKDWIAKFTPIAKSTLPSKSSTAAREIAWRFVEQKAELNRTEWLQAVHIDVADDPDAARLPVDIYWVYRHPLLSAPAGSESPALEKAGMLYESANPCPNNGARSRLNSARREEKSIEAFMRYVDKILAGTAATRRIDEAARGAIGVVELAEEEAIADLELQLQQELEEKLMEFGGKEDQEDAGDD